MDRRMASGVKWIAIAALGGAVGMGCGGGGGGTGGSGGDETGAGGSGGDGAGGGTGGTSAAPTFADVHAVLQAANCTNGYCHGAGTGTLTMTADADATYAALVDQPAGGVPCMPSGLTRVVPGDAENSLLWQKIAPDVTPCGDKMPQGGVLLAADQVEIVRAWIAGGAKK